MQRHGAAGEMSGHGHGHGYVYDHGHRSSPCWSSVTVLDRSHPPGTLRRCLPRDLEESSAILTRQDDGVTLRTWEVRGTELPASNTRKPVGPLILCTLTVVTLPDATANGTHPPIPESTHNR